MDNDKHDNVKGEIDTNGDFEREDGDIGEERGAKSDHNFAC